jgi:hypothetical protein
MPDASFQPQPYDLALGMEFVALWVMMIFSTVLIFSFKAQYRLMNAYDEVSSENGSEEARIRTILNHIKRIVFAVLGYQGEDRERLTVDQLSASWVTEHFRAVFIRFCTFYFIYIWALILTTRALRIEPDTGVIHVLPYTSKQIFGFVMIGVYIASNAVCDILSIAYAVKQLDTVRQDPRLSVAAIAVMKTLGCSFVFFIISQIVSNVIWPYKTNLHVPLEDRIFSLTIALWPYAFVFDAGSEPRYLPLIFPGQLLITGTVFLPTLLSVALFMFFSATIFLTSLIKRALTRYNLTWIIITLDPGQKPVAQFRCLNAFTVGVASSVMAAIIYDAMKSMLLR